MPFNDREYYLSQMLNADKYQKRIGSIYDKFTSEFIRLGDTLKYNPDKLFSFYSYPQTNARVKKLMADMVSEVRFTVLSGITKSWDLANTKNDDLVSYVFKNKKLTKKDLWRYTQHNEDALAAFKKRKVRGFTLSERIWEQQTQFKREVELALEVGLGEGKSGVALSRDVRKNLKDPENLFRRVRNKKGKLVPSKAMKAYHPGVGVYRSSYKNALRMTGTEINMAYRTSDYERWQQLDFIVGFEVHTSHNHPMPDVCDDLKGKYPKSFKFTGWHPQCRCYMTSIMKTDEELEAEEDAILDGKAPPSGSSNEVTEVPPNFTKWVKENKDKIERAKSKPYFIRDNAGMLKKATKAKTTRDVIKHIPGKIGDYEVDLGVKVDRSVFDLLNDPVKLRITHQGGAYFRPDQKDVTISINERRLASKWNAEAVVYHEFGHAIDFQRNIRNMPEVTGLMAKYRKKLAADNNAGYKSTDEALWKEGEDAYNAGKRDLSNQTGAAHDTLAALNPQFGAGHQKSYWRTIPEADKLEFVAHMFENYFIGNPVFEKHLPELYADMRAAMTEIVDQIKQK